jgi:predicted lipoprotein
MTILEPRPLKPALARHAGLAGAAVLAGSAAQAQTVPSNVSVPFYTAGDFMRGVYRFWYAPQAAAFAEQAGGLPTAISAVCDADAGTAAARLEQARERWKASALAWDRLSGVQIGPLVQRRSARQIDFTPTRPELIKRAIQAAPQDATAMESIGTPAKGLPALEWLLWSQPIAPAHRLPLRGAGGRRHPARSRRPWPKPSTNWPRGRPAKPKKPRGPR